MSSSEGKNPAVKKVKNQVHWYTCKGVSYQDGDIFKSGRPPRCFGIRTRVTNPDVLNALNQEVPQKHWKGKKHVNLTNHDFVHTCVGTSHYHTLNDVSDSKQKQWLYEKDLVRCRAGLDIFSTSKNEDLVDETQGQVLDETLINEENKVLSNQNESEALSQESRDSSPRHKNRKLENVFEINEEVSDMLDLLKSGGKYAGSLGGRTLTEMEKNADFVSEQIFNLEFPQRFADSSNKITNNFGPTVNNCIAFAKKLYRSVMESYFDDDDDNTK